VTPEPESLSLQNSPELKRPSVGYSVPDINRNARFHTDHPGNVLRPVLIN
jgi:hypothetical protein